VKLKKNYKFQLKNIQLKQDQNNEQNQPETTCQTYDLSHEIEIAL